MTLTSMARLGDIVQALDGIRDRLSLQKSVYILQKMEVDLDYEFRWYTLGPYSIGLANTMSAALDVGILAAEHYGYKNFQPGKTYEELEDRKKFIARKDPRIVKFKPLANRTSRFLECAGSLLYLSADSIRPMTNKSDAFVELERRKPGKFKDNLKEEAWISLAKLGLVIG